MTPKEGEPLEAVKTMHFDGPCPFLFCLATGPHDHPICPKCGTVRYGNLFCDECRKNVDIHRELAIIECEILHADLRE